MSRGVNKVILVGTLGRDPDTKYMPSGGAVTNISLATSDQWKDKNTGERQERTEWHRVVFFNKLAEISGQYLRKGQQVYVEGRLQTRKWQTQDGQDRYSTEIIADQMQMLGGGRGNSDNDSGENFNAAPAPQNKPSQAPSSNTRSAPSQPPAADQGFEDFDDDITF